jgi:hypothetical protein
MSQKKVIKSKIVTPESQKPPQGDKEVIIDLSDKPIAKPVVKSPVRTLVPQVVSTPPEDDDNDVDEASDAEDQPQTATSVKRRTRTKKTYPPSDDMFEELIKSMCELREISRKIITLARETQKSSKKEVKDLNLKIKKEKNEKPTRKPRGFALPSPISNEMVDYLVKEAGITQIERKINDQSSCPVKIEYGCLLARNELTSALCNHFRTSLMRKNEADKRDIHLDEKTTKLFGIDKQKFIETGGRLSGAGEPIITYFDLQKYLPKHCGKQATGH